ncbi:MAG: aldehyde ferredoxin oxidoreductase family protein [Deltaproteobacteria bacterium]|nr:aldehyde ferredoxin oxidoreductase family protein [Deltaproteobacteria bacterium]
MFGYMGKILRVDLSSGEIKNEPIDMQMAQNFIGGAGFATKIIYDEVPAKADPLGPENRLIFMTGPVTGTRFPTSGRFAVGGKSPLTGILATATSSGFWGPELKRTGHDGIIFEGKAATPVYLEILDDKVALKDATDLWGKDAYETQDILRKRSGKRTARVACIGPAGERLSPISCIINDEGRAAGRGGLGAVMGSKNLKAILCGGTQKITPAADEYLKMMAKEVTAGVEADPFAGMFTKWGTAFSMDMGWAAGDVPAKNWQVGLWQGGEGYAKIGGSRMADTILKPHAGACFNCPIRCARWVSIPSGRFKYEGPGPEYETLGAFGSMLMIDDLEAIAWMGELCNKYGLDTISTGCTIAWAVEAFEKGALTKKDTGGLDLTWGNVDAVIETVERMGRVEGFGALLAKGSREASRVVGKGSQEYAIQVKGMEVPMHDPRCYFSLAVNYATGMRGACHVQGSSYTVEMAVISPEAGLNYKQGRHDKKNKGLAAKVAQDLSAIYNSVALCMFAGMALQPSHYGILLGITAGLPFDANSILQAGDRITTLQRAFACREGIGRKDDTLPKRLLTALPEGGAAGKAADLEYQLNEYYRLRGWNEKGIPAKEKLQALGLQKAADDLYA